MSLSNEVLEYARAAFAGIWVRTYEDVVALMELRQLCAEQRFLFVTYDISEGVAGSVEFAGDGDKFKPCKLYEDRNDAWTKSPTAFLRDIPEMLASTNLAIEERLRAEHAASGKGESELKKIVDKAQLRLTLVVLRNGHFGVLVPPQSHVQLLQNLLVQGKNSDFRILVTSPIIAIPLELERYFVVAEHELPDKDTLRSLAEEMCESDDDKPTDAEGWRKLMEAAAGLTTYEAENAYSLSLIRKKKLDVSTVWDVKSQTVKKRGLLTIYQGDDSFDNLGGLQEFKDFTTSLLDSREENPLLRPKGVLLLGVPGSGKSASVRCLGNAVNRRVLTLDLSRVRSKFQGESENNLLDAIKVVDSMQPCILFVDEIEKGLSGAGSGGEVDSGVSDRMFGSFLTWLNDHTSDVFVVATCNKIASLPPEFSRAERFDAMFFFDLPTPSERKAIWKIYLKMFDFKYDEEGLEQFVKLSKRWTGAEIRTCCRLARMRKKTIHEAADTVTIIANTAPEQLSELRSWASGRCLSTNRPGVYQKKDEDAPVGKQVTIAKKPKRKILRGDN